MSVVVSDNPGEHRFEAHVEGRLAGIAEYYLDDDQITFFHTEVDPEFEGQGIAGEMARYALDAVRADGALRVVPKCPYFRAWIRRHPDYADLVAVAST